mgnify:FL=1
MIPKRDKKRTDVLAVATKLPKHRARALGSEPGRRDLKFDAVGLRVTPPNEPAGGEFAKNDIGDRAAPDVVGSAQERARPEKTPQRAIGEGRKRFEEGGRGHCTMHAFPRVLGGDRLKGGESGVRDAPDGVTPSRRHGRKEERNRPPMGIAGAPRGACGAFAGADGDDAIR